MLEIKCPKSRIITGIIPDSYYAQIQGQLEVCDLEYCDFLECDIKEYSDKNSFFKDSPYGENVSCYLQANNNEKGIIIELYDTQKKRIHIFIVMKNLIQKKNLMLGKNKKLIKF